VIAVGLRELKNKLSEYVRRVREGEEVLVTDRGEVVAELRPPSRSVESPAYPGLTRLIQQGKARMGAPNSADLYPRLKALLPEGSSLRLLSDERAEDR
jgi:antitoxin (DNA-binding transcriptional repressor) of toxin-antitoxin stability system